MNSDLEKSVIDSEIEIKKKKKAKLWGRLGLSMVIFSLIIIVGFVAGDQKYFGGMLRFRWASYSLLPLIFMGMIFLIYADSLSTETVKWHINTCGYFLTISFITLCILGIYNKNNNTPVQNRIPFLEQRRKLH